MADDPALAEAATMAAPFEGFRGAPYQDSAEVWTIGYGTTRMPDGSPVGPDTPPIDEPVARAWLMRDMRAADDSVRTEATVPLTTDEEAALDDFAYNLGADALGGSTLLRLLNAGDYEGAAGQFERWDMAGGVALAGLLRRRRAEAALFRQDMGAEPVLARDAAAPAGNTAVAPQDGTGNPGGNG